MEAFIHRQNLLILRKQLGHAKDDAQRFLLLRLLAEEEKKDKTPYEPELERTS